MADGYARATGKVGVAIATSGPGATNMVTGIATAMMDSSPIVCITGQVGSALIGSDAFQETDITGITLPITKHNYLVTRAAEVAPAVREDIAIANWFSDTESFPERQLGELVKVTDLAYGENPHQRAAYYMEAGARRHLLSMVRSTAASNSRSTTCSTSTPRPSCEEFTVPACVIVKHGNPCGCALASTPEEAYRKALASDPASAFGGWSRSTARSPASSRELVAEQFVEVLHAPGYGEGAVDLLREKLRNLRLLESDERRRPTPGRARCPQRARGHADPGSRHGVRGPRHDGGRRRRSPTEREWGDLLFAWRVVKHVRSNAIVIARDTARSASAPGRCRASTPRGWRSARRSRRSAARCSPPTPSSRSPTACRPRSSGRARDHRAGRLEARRRGHRRGREGRRHARLHGSPPLLALGRPRRRPRLRSPPCASSPRSSTWSATRRSSGCPSCSPRAARALLAKLEYLNPGGSIKDRIGLPMVEAAERDGPAAARAARSSSRPPATPASAWPWSRRSAATTASS